MKGGGLATSRRKPKGTFIFFLRVVTAVNSRHTLDIEKFFRSLSFPFFAPTTRSNACDLNASWLISLSDSDSQLVVRRVSFAKILASIATVSLFPHLSGSRVATLCF